VNDALQQAGVKPAEIVRTRFRSNPRWEYDATFFRSKRSSYEAIHTIELLTLGTSRAGGRDGMLEEIIVTAQKRSAAAINTQLEPSDVTVSAHVAGRWVFIPRKS